MIDWELEKQKGLLYSQMPEHQYLVNKTKNFIKWSLSKVEDPYVACSFGKDSAVMLHLVLSFMPNIDVRFVSHPETKYLANFEDVKNEWIERFSINFKEIYLHRDKAKETRGDTQRKALNNCSNDSYFVGLRKDEGGGRDISLSVHGSFYKGKGKVRISPLRDWSDKDVLAYISKHNLPMLDKYKLIGLKARTSSGLPHNKMLSKEFLYLKKFKPSNYNNLINLYPDINDLL